MSPAEVAANAFRYWVFTPAPSLTLLSVDFILGDYAGPDRDPDSHPFPLYPILP